MSSPGAVTYTEAEIREVMATHYPNDHADNDDPYCACGLKETNRSHCFYCAAPVPEDYRQTQHKKGCKAEASGFQKMGVTILSSIEFTADHLIEMLKEHHERALADHP